MKVTEKVMSFSRVNIMFIQLPSLRQLVCEILFHCVNISYLVDQCISLARSQALEKNVLSWALTGTGSVVSIRQVSSQHPASPLRVCVHAHFLFLFGAKVLSCEIWKRNFLYYLMISCVYFVHVFGYNTG